MGLIQDLENVLGRELNDESKRVVEYALVRAAEAAVQRGQYTADILMAASHNIAIAVSKGFEAHAEKTI